MTERLKFDSIISIGGEKLTKKYIQSLNLEQREMLVEPIFEVLRTNGFLFPDNDGKLQSEYNRLIEYKPDLGNRDVFNNSSLGTGICKYFCRESFYRSTERGKRTMEEVFNDDGVLKGLIRNRLGMGWYADVNESFNLSFRMVLQGMRSMRLVPSITIFKPSIAKYVCLKYSSEGETVGDYSMGFGGRLLGAMSCGRRYVGTDPLTARELGEMVKFYGFKNCLLIGEGSEGYIGDEDSVDLYWSSPPYYDQEYYSGDISQAYNRGEGYFYDEYWGRTLRNVRRMLKPGRWFGLNVKNNPRMLDMAVEVFGPWVETVDLRTIRSHLNKSVGVSKFEYIYMFRNGK